MIPLVDGDGSSSTWKIEHAQRVACLLAEIVIAAR